MQREVSSNYCQTHTYLQQGGLYSIQNASITGCSGRLFTTPTATFYFTMVESQLTSRPHLPNNSPDQRPLQQPFAGAHFVTECGHSEKKAACRMRTDVIRDAHRVVIQDLFLPALHWCGEVNTSVRVVDGKQNEHKNQNKSNPKPGGNTFSVCSKKHKHCTLSYFHNLLHNLRLSSKVTGIQVCMHIFMHSDW